MMTPTGIFDWPACDLHPALYERSLENLADTHGYLEALLVGQAATKMKLTCLNQAVAWIAVLLIVPVSLRAADSPRPSKPNIVYILCDDLGYGDVQCLNRERGKIATPNIDRLASQGMTFTDCHAAASVCSPSRYGILTGRYCWRTQLQQSALPGDAPPLIAPDRLTVASLLKQHGYATTALGKWHLGMTFGKEPYTDRITDGPTNHGFDYYFGISASADLPPYVYIENDRFTEVPTVTKEWGTDKWGLSGLAAKDFDWADVLPNLTRKAVTNIDSQAAAEKPFFLYLALNSPHTPLVPTKEWQGKSGLGDYGDFVMETDWAVGQVLAALDKAGIAGNTLVILTSDNGCAPYVDVADLEAKGHFPSANFRGYKFDIWDGGHRVAFLVRWPGQVRAASRNDQLVCLTDLLATCADILGEKLPDNTAEDSVSLLPAMLGRDTIPLHEAIVHHSTRGFFAIRQGNWKLALCSGAGGWAKPSEDELQKSGSPAIQLYDMSTDSGERQNLQAEHPQVVDRLTRLLEGYVAAGRSTRGAPQQNDAPVDTWKRSRPDQEAN
jgi:arylsulfatase A